MAGRISWRVKAHALFALLFLAFLGLPSVLELRLVSSFSDNLFLSDAMSLFIVYGALIVAFDLSALLALTGVNINVCLTAGTAKDRFYENRASSPDRYKKLIYCAICVLVAVPVALAHTMYCDQITGDRCMMDGFDAIADFGWSLTLASFTAVFTVLFRACWSLYQIAMRICDPDAHLSTRLFGARD